MLGLYAAVEGLPAGAFDLGALPHLRLTVNDYPTWTYPDTAADAPASQRAAAPPGLRSDGGATREGGASKAARRRAGDDGDKLLLLEHADDSAVTVLAQQGDYEGFRSRGPAATGFRCRSSRRGAGVLENSPGR